MASYQAELENSAMQYPVGAVSMPATLRREVFFRVFVFDRMHIVDSDHLLPDSKMRQGAGGSCSTD